MQDIACCTLHGFKQLQLARGIFNGSPHLKRTTSQNSGFDEIDPNRLIGDHPAGAAI